MKTLMIVPFVLLPFVSKTKAEDPLPFESISISPFYLNKESTVVVTTKSSYLRVLLFIQNDKHTNAAVLVKEIYEPGTYVYKYDNSYTRSKNRVFVRYSTGGTSLDTQHLDRNVPKSSYLNITNNQSLTSDESLAVLYGDMSYSLKTLTYSFSGFEGIYVPTYFHKIDLTDFQILISKEERPFFTCNPTLSIKNYENAFNKIGGETETVTIPLNIIETENGFSFALANDYYVDPASLKMYTYPTSSSFPKTKHIYLPRNEMKNQDKYECYFMLSEFGIDRDLLIHHFDIKANKNIFGDCKNSQYCIVRE